MPLLLVRDDITHMEVDAIVNVSEEILSAEGTTGSRLLAACRRLWGRESDGTRLMEGHDLPARYIIHTAVPHYQDGRHGEEKLLRRCYKNVLTVAYRKKLETVATPLIGVGSIGYPAEKALLIAEEEIGRFLRSHDDITVYMVLRSKTAMEAAKRRFPYIAQHIDATYLLSQTNFFTPKTQSTPASTSTPAKDESAVRYSLNDSERVTKVRYCLDPGLKELEEKHDSERWVQTLLSGENLRTYIAKRDETFSTVLLSLIESKGMSDAQCYKKANVDRKLFSKIRSDKNYRPSKSTVLAFAFALKLTLEETEALLKRAGYALSHAFVQDIIVEYFIEHRQYDIFAVNEALFAFDQPLLGGR